MGIGPPPGGRAVAGLGSCELGVHDPGYSWGPGETSGGPGLWVSLAPGWGLRVVGRAGGGGLSPSVNFPLEVACASRERNVRGTFLPQARARTHARRGKWGPSAHPCNTAPPARGGPRFPRRGAAGVGWEFPAERGSRTLTGRTVSRRRLVPRNFQGCRGSGRGEAPVRRRKWVVFLPGGCFLLGSPTAAGRC